LEQGGEKVLIDCGIFQGSSEFEDKNIDIKQMFVEEALVYKVEMVTLTSQGGNNG